MRTAFELAGWKNGRTRRWWVAVQSSKFFLCFQVIGLAALSDCDFDEYIEVVTGELVVLNSLAYKWNK